MGSPNQEFAAQLVDHGHFSTIISKQGGFSANVLSMRAYIQVKQEIREHTLTTTSSQKSLEAGYDAGKHD